MTRCNVLKQGLVLRVVYREDQEADASQIVVHASFETKTLSFTVGPKFWLLKEGDRQNTRA